jgi:trimeric autotransporter adhesin
MSTKTTFKRVALVAVAALGLGVLTSVAPATAASSDVTAVSAGTSAPARVGVIGGSTTITLTVPATTTAIDVTAQITSAPATSTAATLTFAASTGSTAPVGGTYTDTSTATGSYLAAIDATGVAQAANFAAHATAATTTLSLKIKADVAGTYQILVAVGGSSATGYSAGLKSVAYSITTAGAPAALSLNSYAGKVVSLTTANAAAGVALYGGQLFALTMKDANGNATVLGLNEAIALSDNSDATTKIYSVGSYALSSVPTEITTFAQSQDVSGTYFVRVVAADVLVAGSGTLTASGSGLLSSSLTTNGSYTKVLTTDATSTLTVGCTTTTLCVVGTGTAAAPYKVSAAPALTLGIVGSTSVTVYNAILVANKLGLTYNDSVSAAAATTAATTVTYAGPSVDSTYATASVQLMGATTSGDTGRVYFTYTVPAAASIAVQGQATVLSATAGKNTFTALVSDQYGVKIAYTAVTIGVSGRNTVATTSIGVTDANGLITYSLTDAGTTGTKDTFTFTASGVATAAIATVNYGTVTVSTVTVTGGATADTIAGTTKTAISAADNGPEASALPIKAVVKDASGNLLAGVPVVFTVDSGAIKKTAAVDYATVYTGSDGSATTYAFGWTVSKQTVTATAGGVAKTGYINWVATDATSARVLSAAATGDIVSLKVVDRFGNAVQGVSIDLSRTGAGLFGNGASTQTISTDKLGTADVRFIGSGTVVAELADTYAQAYDVAGQIEETAVTAAVAGTTKGTGASLAPAGVAKVSITIAEGADPVAVSAQAAADAAAEATDAANAATDAANAAAEAADAATAAAQDAADAVAALATSVEAMVAALRKQITALTNLVIKIQKKVKA